MRHTAVSDRQLTLAHLDRQMLLERRAMPAAEAVRRLVALQAQYSPSPYIALHARLEGFATTELEGALRSGQVVKSTLMRGTLHLVHSADYGHHAAASRAQAQIRARAASRSAGSREQELVAALSIFLQSARSTDEIRQFLGAKADDVIAPAARLDFARAHLPLVHVPPSGFWRRHGKFSLRLWDGEAPDPRRGTVELIGKYLSAFGPASRADIAAFTGLRLRDIDPALAELAPVRRLTDPTGRELVDATHSRLPDEDLRPPLRFLAKWDAALISRRDRGRIVPVEAYSTLFGASRNGDVLQPVGAAPIPADAELEGLRLLRFLHPGARQLQIQTAPAASA